MTNPVALLRTIRDGDTSYPALMVWCPGCEYPDEDGRMVGGLHMLPVAPPGKPHWTFDGNLERPTLSPSILTRINRPEPMRCHSYLRAGVWEFLADCTHQYAGQRVASPPLPDWVVRE